VPSSKPLRQTAARSSGLRTAAARCGVLTLMYTAARSLFSLLGSAVMRLWLGGPGVGAPLAVWELAQWSVSLAAGTLALLVPVWLARRPARPAALLRRVPRRGIMRFLLPVWLGASQLGSMAAGALARQTEGGSAVTLPTGWPAMIPAFFALCLMPAVLEELLFRGVLQTLLRPWGAALAVVGQAVLFGVLHSGPAAMLYAVLSGLFFGFLAEQSDSLWPGMVLHGLNNTLSFVLLWLQSGGYPMLAQGLSMVCAVVFSLWGLAAGLIWLVGRRRVLRPLGPGVSPMRLLRCPGWLVPAVGLALLSAAQALPG